MRKLPVSGAPLAVPWRCTVCTLGKVSPACCPLREARLAPGQPLLLEGQPPERIWLLRRGTIVFGCTARDGSLGSCGVRGAGALLGLEGLLQGGVMPHGVWALTELVACSVDLGTFRRWISLDMDGSPGGVVLALALRESSMRSMDRQNLDGPAVQRVARFLWMSHQVTSGEDPLELQQNVVARVLGMRPETLSRALATLRRRRAIAEGRRLQIAEPSALRRLAGL